MFQTVLTKFTADIARLFGQGSRLQPVGYELRPYSQLLRVAVDTPGDVPAHRHCFLKVFKPKPVPDGDAQMRRRVEHDYAVNLRIHDALVPFPGCGAVRPVACYPDDLAIVTEEAVGQTLLAHLEANAAWFPSRTVIDSLALTMAATGRWLKAFQTIDPSDDDISADELRAYIDHRLTRLVAAGSPVVTAAARDQLLRHIDELTSALPVGALRSVMIHADLAPGNVLVSGDRIVVLDFAMTSRGTRLHDLTRLFLQTDLLGAKPQFRRRVLDALLTALLNGFDPALTPRDPLFRLLSLLHRVNHLATLTLSRAPLPASLYNRRLRAIHAAWLRSELRVSSFR